MNKLKLSWQGLRLLLTKLMKMLGRLNPKLKKNRTKRLIKPSKSK